MFWVLAIPIVGILGAAIGAASQRRKGEALAPAAGGVAGGGPGAATGSGAATAGTTAGTTSQGTPTAGAQAAAGTLSQADMLALVTAAITSQKPDRMREAANQIRAQYPMQAQTLEMAAQATEQAQAGVQPQQQPPVDFGVPSGGAGAAGGGQVVIYGPQPTTTGGAAQPGAMTAPQALTLAGAALASQNPDTMLQAAKKLRDAGFGDQATALEVAASAANIARNAQQQPPAQQPPAQQPPAQQPPAQQPPATATPAQVAASMGIPWTPEMQAAVDKMRAQMQAAGLEPTIEQILTAIQKAQQAGGQVPPVQQPPAQQPPAGGQSVSGKAMAAEITKLLQTTIKGKNEPRDKIKLFQIAERLSRTDGSYGSETAIAIADRYGIVPAKPLYWGAKGGTYQTLVNDKNQYKTHLLNLASADAPRADEWRAAAAV